ncbi:MAG: hypothetical protein KGQ36_05085 [Rickettsiales bacterium]|nr:hypothetical protein [Rickettsiales bacterium]
MSAVSNIYLIIFLPLLSSILCQFSNKKFLPFLVTIASCVILLLLTTKAFSDVLQYKTIANDFELGLFSIALEFRLDAVSALFLSIMIFTKIAVLLYYHQDLENFIEDKKFFLASYLISIFGLIGVFISNNLLNLFLFLEIYAVSFFTISTFAKDKEISKSYFEYFCFNAALSLLLLFCFITIYLVLGDLTFDQIAKDVVMLENKRFLRVIFILLLISFLGKFFLSQIYFAKSNNNLLAKFLSTDFLFTKINLGIFLILKFTYEIFDRVLTLDKTIFAPFIFFLSFVAVLYFSFRIYRERNLKNISIYFCLSNLAFIFSCIFIKTTESLQSLFFFILNFSLVNFTIFIFSLFLEKHFGNAEIDKLKLLKKNSSLILSFKILLFFIVSFPFTTSFFALWHLINAAFEPSFKIILLPALVIMNFVQVVFAFKIMNVFFSDDVVEENAEEDTEEDVEETVMPKFGLQILLLLFLVIINLLPIVFLTVTNNISLNFASHLI